MALKFIQLHESFIVTSLSKSGKIYILNYSYLSIDSVIYIRYNKLISLSETIREKEIHHMKIIHENNCVIINNLIDFNLSQTLECGQCFRYYQVGNNRYILVAFKKVLEIEQTEKDLIFYNTTLEDYNLIWKDYFDLDTNYKEIKDYLTSKDKKMYEIIQYGAGIRILNQDFVEVLLSFIISQNKQIPQIKQVVEQLCRRFGELISEYKCIPYYSFPTLDTLCKLTEEDFKECKAGFRAKYLVDACSRICDGRIKEKELRKLPSSEIREKLCEIKGVGIKVSNCVLLYGLGQKEAFPIDVWIKRIMENLYFQGETKIDILQSFAEERFGIYGGYAQQYLFYYSRIKL